MPHLTRFLGVGSVLTALALGPVGCSSHEGVTAPAFLEAEGAAITLAEPVLVLEGDEWGWRGELEFSFRNRSDRTISLLNCNGSYGLRLDKWDGSDWVLAWSPVLPMCLSPPTEIAPGEALPQTLGVFGGRPERNLHPQFLVSELEGTYRLVISAAFWDYDHDGPDWGTPVPIGDRSSGPFQIRVEG